MKFSIVTVSLNEKNRIKRTLSSVFFQTFTDYEHIIKDGGSLDGTLDIINTFKNENPTNKIIAYVEKDNSVYDAMNQAIDKVHGEYVCFMNSGDVFYDNNVLEKVNRCIEDNPGGDVYYGDTIIVFPNDSEYLQVMALDVDELHSDNVLSKSGTNLMHQAMFSEKECLIEHKFSSEYHLRAELNWYYQTISEGKKYIRMNIPICRYSLGGISERSSSAQLNFEETKHIINSYGYDASEYEKRVFNASVSRDIYKNIYNNWLSLRQSGITMRDYLYSKNISRVAIFGYGELGCHIINELKDTNIKIICIIESSHKYQYSNIPILTPDKIGDMNDVDIIIVASIIRSKEIIDMYQKRTPYKMVPLENILEDMWNESTA